MTRLLVEVEGQTEETFVNEILAPHLYQLGYTQVGARLLGNARQRDRRGGIRAWTGVRTEILRHLRGDPGALVTTMVDYYGLPATGGRAWPGRLAAKTLPFAKKAITVEAALLTDVNAALEPRSPPDRFLPFVIMHEFEALLFSDCERFGEGIERPDLVPSFQAIRDQFASPEEINDSAATAPSKRVEALVPGYEKPLLGALAVLTIGLDALRRECPHFGAWLTLLEARAP
jgi:hypothetical protein